MKKTFRLAATMLVMLCLMLGSCVELDGQRVSLFYDSAKDELRMLFFYDGIHESKTQSEEKGPVAIPKFVKNGDVMLMDWWAQLKLAELREAAAKPEPALAPGEKPKPAARALLVKSVASIKTNGIGRYTNADGHIGAAQLIVVSNASKLIEAINAAINEDLILDDSPITGDSRMTRQLCITAAKANRQWIKIDGHSIIASAPVNAREWAKAKYDFFRSFIEKTPAKNGEEDNAAKMKRAAASLASVALSIEETGGEVRIRIGDPKTPTTARLQLRDEYEPSLEPVVKANVLAELSTLILEQISSGNSATAGVADVVAWGPPEETVKALLAASNGTTPAAAKAKEQLAAWAKKWNAAESSPAAPEGKDGAAATTDQWRDWLRAMSRFPIDVAAPAAPTSAPVK